VVVYTICTISHFSGAVSVSKTEIVPILFNLIGFYMEDNLYRVQEAIEQQCKYDTIQRNVNDLVDKKQGNAESATYYGAPHISASLLVFCGDRSETPMPTVGTASTSM
jgi:hypothetical protein